MSDAHVEPRTPAQITALVIGVWWTTNGIGAFLLDPNLTTSHVRGSGDLFGVTITVNGWHALFHLIPGLLGIAAARRPRSALTFTFAAGGLYVVVGAWGLVVGGTSLGVIAVDTTGDLVHLLEGVLTMTGGIVTRYSSGHPLHEHSSFSAVAQLAVGLRRGRQRS